MKVFVSSTIEDLKEERETVRSVLNNLKYESFISEYEGAVWSSSAEKILNEIENCDIYIGIMGRRYGQVPQAKDSDDDLFDSSTSVTEIEFKKARQLNKPTLIYIKDYKNSPPEEKQLKFIKKMEDLFKGYFRYKFSDTTDLRDRLKKDLNNLITELVRGKYRYPEEPRMTIILCEDSQEVANVGANFMIETMKRYRFPKIGLFTGKTSTCVYNSFIEMFRSEREEKGDKGFSFANVEAFVDGEFFGVEGTNPNSYQNFLNRVLFNKIEEMEGVKLDRNNKIHFMPGTISEGNIETKCEDFNVLVRGRIHTQLMGVAPDGQSMFLSPGKFTCSELLNLKTSFVELSDSTYEYITPKAVVPYVFTIGSGNILSYTDRVVLLAYGAKKSDVIRDLILKPISISARLPVNILKKHKNLILVVDRDCTRSLPKNWKDEFRVIDFEKLNYDDFFKEVTINLPLK